MYVNGDLVASAPDQQALVDTDAPFAIGSKSGGGAGARDGTIDEPAVYNSALTSGTIKNHYLSGKGIAGPPDAVAPAKPAKPTATAGDGTATINLSPFNSEPDLASYTLKRKKASDPDTDTAWANVKTGITTWPVTDTSLSNGTTYQYRVVALDVSGNVSPASDAVSVTPAAPVAIVTPPTSGGGGGTVTPPPFKDTIKPVLKMSIAKAFARASAFKKGLKVTVSCSEACSFKTTLTIDSVAAKRIHISRTIATKKGKLSKAGKKTITIKLSKKVQRALKRLRKNTVTVKTKATDLAGNSSSKSLKTVLR